MKNKSCLYCGKEFKPIKCSNFCSQKCCAYYNNHKLVDKECKICGTIFKATRGNRRKYCSVQCANISKKILVKRVDALYVEKHTYELESLNTVVENAKRINIIIHKKRIAVSDVEKNLYELAGLDIAQMNVNLSGVKSI